jgi:transposase
MEVSSVAPKGSRERVLFQWLQGISRDDIARNVGIGASTASGIIEMYRQNNSNFDQHGYYNEVRMARKTAQSQHLRNGVRRIPQKQTCIPEFTNS